jgi:hypothetical protein
MTRVGREPDLREQTLRAPSRLGIDGLAAARGA